MRLLRELAPSGIIHLHQQPVEPGEVIPFRPKSQISEGNADDLWRDCVEKGLFGADTSDYSSVPKTEGTAEHRMAGIDTGTKDSSKH